MVELPIMRLALTVTLLLSPSLVLAAPFFSEQTAQLGPQPCDGADEGCYTNYAILADLDGDGALDVLFPNAKGFYTMEQPAEPLVILRNDGTANFADVSESSVGGFTGWLREIALADIDGDLDLDIAAPDAWNGPAALFINDGSGQFTDEASSRWDVTTRAGSVRFVDVDDDGDADLVVGDWGDDPNPGNPSPSTLHLWLNDGIGNFTGADAQIASPLPQGSSTPIDLDVLDLDDDFDLDVLVNMRNGDLVLFRNDGAGTFTTAALPEKLGPYSYNPGVCDVDADGDLDLWVDNGFAVAYPQLLINDGAGNFEDETSARVPEAVQGQDDNGVVCADLDGDGDFDAVVMSLGNGVSVENNERVLLNDGAGAFTLLPDAFPLVGDATLGLDLGDLDGDGRLDAVTGQGEFGDFTNRLYLSTSEVAVDTRAPNFRAVEEPPATLGPSETPVVHFAITDEVTTDTGPRLSDVRVEWTGAAGLETIAVTFAGGDVFRAQLPSRGSGGNVTWRVCATDHAGNNACSADKSYVVDGDSTTGSGGSGGDGESGEGCSCELAAPAEEWRLGVLAVLALVLLRRRGPRHGKGEPTETSDGGPDPC